MKLKNTNCDKTKKNVTKLKVQIVRKLKKTQIVTKLKKLEVRNYFKKRKLLQNLKTQIATKLKNSNCDKTQKIKL